MATSNTNFSLSSLDPDTLKQSLIEFLQSNPLFKDFNYKGPNISLLLDILSRNSFLNSFLVNMAFAESQLDSAQLRDSVVSHSKPLGYIPSSMTSSVGYVDLTIQTTSGNVFIIPTGTNFSGTNSNNTFNFITDKDYIQISGNGTFNFSNVALYEGKIGSDTFVVDGTVNNQIFTLSNPNIDISSLSILVSENKGSTNNYFEISKNIYGVNGNTKVFYLQGAEGNTYQFYFGDGVLGYKPQNGAVVVAKYRLTQGDQGNDSGTFILVDVLNVYNNTYVTNTAITTLANSSGGSQAEDIGSIKFNAPKAFQTQDRAITANDYKNLILKNYPQVGDVHVYGGNVTSESVDFGSVYISSVSKSGNPLTNSIKEDIKSYLQTVGIITLDNSIKFVDANNIWINVNTNIHVDFSQTNNSPSYYKSLATNNIINFFSSNLQKYNKPFVYSNFTSMIDSIDSNNIIIGNETSFTIQKNVDITLGTNNNVYFTFNNAIKNLNSSQFIVNSYLSFITDSYANVNIAKGTVSLISFDANNVVYSNTVGTIDYSTGTISIPNLMVNAYTTTNSGLSFVASPNTKLIEVKNNDIIKLNINSLVVNTTNG